MYRCPNCKELSISGFSQLTPPFDGNIRCTVCKAELRIKKKITNYLVIIYLFLRAIFWSFAAPEFRLPVFYEIMIVVALGFIQIRFTEYEVRLK